MLPGYQEGIFAGQTISGGRNAFLRRLSVSGGRAEGASEGGRAMIDYEEELKKFQPSLEVEEMADAIAHEDLTDLTDVLRDILSEMGIVRR